MKTRKRRIKRIKLKTKRYLQKFKDKITIKRMKGSGEKEKKKTLKNKPNATVMKHIKSFRTEGVEVLKKMRENNQKDGWALGFQKVTIHQIFSKKMDTNI